LPAGNTHVNTHYKRNLKLIEQIEGLKTNKEEGMNIQIQAAREELARAIEEAKERGQRVHDSELRQFREKVERIEVKCKAAIDAAEELAGIKGLDVMEQGVVYQGSVEMREDGERYGAGRDTRGHIEIKGIPRGKYKALVLLVPDTVKAKP